MQSVCYVFCVVFPNLDRVANFPASGKVNMRFNKPAKTGLSQLQMG